MKMHILAFSVRTKAIGKEGEKLKKEEEKKPLTEISHLLTFNAYSLAKPENEQKLEYKSEDRKGIFLSLLVLYFLSSL